MTKKTTKKIKATNESDSDEAESKKAKEEEDDLNQREIS